MFNTIKRSMSLLLAFILVFTVIFGAALQVNAASVEYVRNGTYIYNWGNREEVATFLSPNAEKFYKDNNTTFSKLAAFSGSSNEDNVPSSALYKELHNLMKKNHAYIISYQKTRDLYQYTDCQNSGKTSKKISSFYSGKEIGPSWDKGTTWNREHTWPNSKGDEAGDGENDIMMLRPAATSENSSRSNRAYGTDGFYDPNMESGGKHNLRGDVARIILYQYVRWECTKASDTKGNRYSIFGTMGVIESKEVLLEWIEEDPVDTWELGRNDSVESITGTRNVFVDYPEFAFLLFGEEIPSGYQTPSGIARDGTTPTPTPDNGTQNNNQSAPRPDVQPDNQPITQPVITACTHAKAQIIAAEDPRCDIEGYTEGKYCPDCKKYISGRDIIEALGHTYTGECDDSCDTCGTLREISSNVEHKFDDDICTICSIKNTDESVVEEETKNENNSDKKRDSSKNNYSWLIIVGGVIIGVVVIIGGGVTLLIIFRKKIWSKENQ